MQHGLNSSVDTLPAVAGAREALDAWVREMVAWHFDPASGCPFWLDYARKLGWDPRERITRFADLGQLDSFADEWARGQTRVRVRDWRDDGRSEDADRL
jgi:hypothetical protein